MIDFDVETTGVQWIGHDLFLAVFQDDSGTVAVLEHPDDKAEIQAWLDRDDDFRAWNTKFDLHFLEQAGYRLPPLDRVHDAMVAAHVVHEQRSIALKAVAGDMFGEAERELEQEVKKWLTAEKARRRKEAKENGTALVPPNYSDVPRDLMRRYAAQDVILTRKVDDMLQRGIDFDKSGGLREVYELERKVLAALYKAENRGIPFDYDSAKAFRQRLVLKMEDLHQRCVDLAGVSFFNPNSSAQIEEALRRRGADLGKAGVTASGKISMDVGSLKRIDDELCRAVLEFRSEFKMLRTYINPILVDHDDEGLEKFAYAHQDFITGRHYIHTNFRQVGARTGRMSSSDPNIQNWPRDDLRLRYLAQADPGMAIVTADLSAIELVVFSAFLGEGKLYEAMCDKSIDPHIMVADMVHLEDRVRAGGEIESRRQRGKTFNYAMIYGGGIRTVSETFGVSEAEARRMIDAYYRAFPEVGDLQRQCRYALEDRG